ncbi:MAG: hypothetical protein HIU88_03500 [Acidobacteria bacterium]|nr:hypothetical protein [Acidobacteriota bacterium]
MSYCSEGEVVEVPCRAANHDAPSKASVAIWSPRDIMGAWLHGHGGGLTSLVA